MTDWIDRNGASTVNRVITLNSVQEHVQKNDSYSTIPKTAL